MAQDCGPVVGSCKHGKRISGFNKSRKYLNWLKYSAFHGRPCTKKSVGFFPSIASTFTGHNCFLHYLTAKAHTGITLPTWHLWFSGISHTVQSKKSKDLIYTATEAWNHTSSMHLVVNKLLDRSFSWITLFNPFRHLVMCITLDSDGFFLQPSWVFSHILNNS